MNKADKIYLFGGICNLTSPQYIGNRRFFWPHKRLNFLASELAQNYISIYEDVRDNGLFGKLAIFPEFGADLVRYNGIDQPSAWMLRSQTELDDNLPLLHATAKDINRHLGSLMPWTLDVLYRTTKKGIRYPKYSLLTDGLHPSDDVAKKIVIQILKDVDDLFNERLPNFVYLRIINLSYYPIKLTPKMRTAVFHLTIKFYSNIVILHRLKSLTLPSVYYCSTKQSRLLYFYCHLHHHHYFHPHLYLHLFQYSHIMNLLYTGADFVELYTCAATRSKDGLHARHCRPTPPPDSGATWGDVDANMNSSTTAKRILNEDQCIVMLLWRIRCLLLDIIIYRVICLIFIGQRVSEQQCSSVNIGNIVFNSTIDHVVYVVFEVTVHVVVAFTVNYGTKSLTHKSIRSFELKLKICCCEVTREQQCSSPLISYVIALSSSACCPLYQFEYLHGRSIILNSHIQHQLHCCASYISSPTLHAKVH